MPNAIAIFDPKSSCNSSGISGSVKFHSCSEHKNTLITFTLSGFKPHATHGIHIHKNGITSLEKACDSTCEHYNPHGKLHGSISLYGNSRHVGDLINNIKCDENGNFNYTYEDDLVKLEAPHSVIGRSIVIHGGVDDLGIFRDFDKGSSTTGNAGSRIACSVIGIVEDC
jgi:Cu-Zn family superoxide dismutase